MSQDNKSNQWPKAFATIFGIAAISSVAYFLKEPQVMWSLILLLFLVERFD